MKTTVPFFCRALLAFCVLAPALSSAKNNPAWPEKEWSHATSAEAGMDEARLTLVRDYALTGGGAGMITRHGRLVLAWGNMREQFDLKSSTKSFGSVALGLPRSRWSRKASGLLCVDGVLYLSPAFLGQRQHLDSLRDRSVAGRVAETCRREVAAPTKKV
jgi:hypothetical protein